MAHDRTMRLGVVADDLTGAADVAGILTDAGARCLMTTGVPQRQGAFDTDAIIVALRSRAMPADRAVAQSRAALAWLRAAGANQILLKICSTFDSTPEGNIGPVAEALLDDLGAHGALVCPAFPDNGRTVYQGHLFVADRLLSESGMERHPLNPMTDPDIRRVLQRQSVCDVGHLPIRIVRGNGAAEAVASMFAAGKRLVIADALTDRDVAALGRIAAGHALVVGGSAIAAGLIADFVAPADRHQVFAPVHGPALVVSGSCSAATARQVERFASRHPSLVLAADADPQAATEAAIAFAARHRDDMPIIHTAADPRAGAEARAVSPERARYFEDILATVARAAIGGGVTRLVVAGGETSGAVASALNHHSYDVGGNVAPGVPLLYPRDAPGRGLVFKSGNFGDDDLFQRALDALESGL